MEIEWFSQKGDTWTNKILSDFCYLFDFYLISYDIIYTQTMIQQWALRMLEFTMLLNEQRYVPTLVQQSFANTN